MKCLLHSSYKWLNAEDEPPRLWSNGTDATHECALVHITDLNSVADKKYGVEVGM